MNTHKNPPIIKKHKEDFWYKLDNAGKIFPAIITSKLTAVFRLSVTLKHPIKIKFLKEAQKKLMGRFPYYSVHLCKGFFWYFLEHSPEIPDILPDSRFPCNKIPVKRRGEPLFRIKVYRCRIAVEFSHILTDGFGALVFLKALTAEYLELAYGPFDDFGDIPRPSQHPDYEEAEDSFIKYYNKDAAEPARLNPAFHLPYKTLGPPVYNIITGTIPLEKINLYVKDKNITINDLFTAILIEAFQESYFNYCALNHKKPKYSIRIVVPINLRKIFPSKTMRNFVLFASPDIDPVLGKYSFDEILHRVHHFIKIEAAAKSLQPGLARNVRVEKNFLIKILPRFLKYRIMNTVYNIVGEKSSSSSLSNLGIVTMPEKLAAFIENFNFISSPAPITKCNCGVISFNNNIYISFGRTIQETEIEKFFFNKLIKLGIPVKIESN